MAVASFRVGVRLNAMKIGFVVLFVFVLLSAVAFGQSGAVLSNQVSVFQIPDHIEHADQHAMATEQSLVGSAFNTYTYAQGERPLWEFGPVSVPVPLGDVARAYRKQKETMDVKPVVVFEKQGS
jgi:hypothetical protein